DPEAARGAYARDGVGDRALPVDGELDTGAGRLDVDPEARPAGVVRDVGELGLAGLERPHRRAPDARLELLREPGVAAATLPARVVDGLGADARLPALGGDDDREARGLIEGGELLQRLRQVVHGSVTLRDGKL